MNRPQTQPDPLAAALARKRLNGARGDIADVPVASGDGWRVHDIICTCGPRDHDAEELTTASSIALVLAGTFTVRDRHGTSLLSEGSYFLASAGHCFACSHRHGEGDRCLSFRFEPELFDRIAHDAGGKAAFAHNRLPPVRPLAPLTARARHAMTRARADGRDRDRTRRDRPSSLRGTRRAHQHRRRIRAG